MNKPAREFTPEERREVVRYANETTLKEAAAKFGVSTCSIHRWRELEVKCAECTPAIKCAVTHSLGKAAWIYGMSGSTVAGWKETLLSRLGEESVDACESDAEQPKQQVLYDGMKTLIGDAHCGDAKWQQQQLLCDDSRV